MADRSRIRASQCSAAILVADGDPAILELIAELLTDEGFVVVSVTSAAVRALVLRSFAVVITDPFILGTSGADDAWATLSSIHAVAGATPLIIFSAHNAGTFADLTVRGCTAVIRKPGDLDVFCAVIRPMIASTQRQSRNIVGQITPLCEPQPVR